MANRLISLTPTTTASAVFQVEWGLTNDDEASNILDVSHHKILTVQMQNIWSWDEVVVEGYVGASGNTTFWSPVTILQANWTNPFATAGTVTSTVDVNGYMWVRFRIENKTSSNNITVIASRLEYTWA